MIDNFQSKIGESYLKYQGDEHLEFGLNTIFEKYQDPSKIDNLISAQSKADQIKIVLHDNIRKLIEREEKLEILVAKSKDLSAQSKQFMKNTKKIGSGQWCFCFK